MKARLNMLELKANFRGKYGDALCDLCKNNEDSTEHLFECEKLISLLGQKLPVDSIRAPNKSLSEYLNQAMLIREWVWLDGVGPKIQKQDTA